MTVLIIATAVIGFGLFGSDLQDGGSTLSLGRILRWFYGLMALAHCGVLVEVVRRLIKQTTPVTVNR